MDTEDLFYHFNDNVAVQALREDLLRFGIGLLVKRRIDSHKILAFPTRQYNLETHKGIWEIDLELNCFIGQTRRAEIMFYLLAPNEFEEWNRAQWESWLSIADKDTKGKDQ